MVGPEACERGRGRVNEKLLTSRELADVLGFSPSTIQDWSENGRIPGFRVGGRLRFRASEVERWLEGQRVGALDSDGDRAQDGVA